MTQPAARAGQVRPEHLVRQPEPRPDPHRRAAAHGRRRTTSPAARPTPRSSRRRSARGDAYDDRHRAARRREPHARRDLRRPDDHRHPAAAATSSARSTTRTEAGDGYASLEVSPEIAYDTELTTTRRQAPVRGAGPAERDDQDPRHAAGPPRDRGVPDGRLQHQHHAALRRRELRAGGAGRTSARWRSGSNAGEPIDRIGSVASFFVSRVDSLVDKLLDEKIAAASGDDRQRLEALKGKAGVANAKIAYAKFKEIFSGERWQRLADAGRAGAALPLGQHQHQEPRLPRRHLRRGADRAGHDQHAAAEHARRVPRSRPPPPTPRRGRRRGVRAHQGARGRWHRLPRGDRPSCRRRASTCSSTPTRRRARPCAPSATRSSRRRAQVRPPGATDDSTRNTPLAELPGAAA